MAGILKVDQVQSDSNLSFQVAGANVAYMNSTGLQMTGGQIVAGSNTLLTASGLIYANAGIAFPATQSSSSDPNTLDDYEEGTWTPSLTTGSSSPTFTYTNRAGTYVKIGAQVIAWFYCDVSVSSAGTGTVGVSTSGFPYTPLSVSYTNAAYTGGGWAVNHPTATGGTAMGFNNDNWANAALVYFQPMYGSGNVPTGATNGMQTGKYSAYIVYRTS